MLGLLVGGISVPVAYQFFVQVNRWAVEHHDLAYRERALALTLYRAQLLDGRISDPALLGRGLAADPLARLRLLNAGVVLYAPEDVRIAKGRQIAQAERDAIDRAAGDGIDQAYQGYVRFAQQVEATWPRIVQLMQSTHPQQGLGYRQAEKRAAAEVGSWIKSSATKRDFVRALDNPIYVREAGNPDFLRLAEAAQRKLPNGYSLAAMWVMVDGRTSREGFEQFLTMFMRGEIEERKSFLQLAEGQDSSRLVYGMLSPPFVTAFNVTFILVNLFAVGVLGLSLLAALGGRIGLHQRLDRLAGWSPLVAAGLVLYLAMPSHPFPAQDPFARYLEKEAATSLTAELWGRSMSLHAAMLPHIVEMGAAAGLKGR